MCRAMKGKDVVLSKRWFRSGKGRCGAVKSKKRWAPCVPRRPVVLRPVNVNGNRARGMRAPENTNQFLMTEKYRLQALRSDSVDSGSDASSDAELTDMDSYLGAWENARGALMDGPDAEGAVFLADTNEDSVQYVPSEDDLLLSDNFMHKDFAEFCDKVTS